MQGKNITPPLVLVNGLECFPPFGRSLVSTTAPSHSASLDRVFAEHVSIFAEPSVGAKEASFTKANVF